jgi:hypothetical protein
MDFSTVMDAISSNNERCVSAASHTRAGGSHAAGSGVSRWGCSEQSAGEPSPAGGCAACRWGIFHVELECERGTQPAPAVPTQ